MSRLGDTESCFICGEVENPDTVLVDLRVHPPDNPMHLEAFVTRICTACVHDLTEILEEMRMRMHESRGLEILALEELLIEPKQSKPTDE
jgi:hypothetical protein